MRRCRKIDIDRGVNAGAAGNVAIDGDQGMAELAVKMIDQVGYPDRHAPRRESRNNMKKMRFGGFSLNHLDFHFL
jgi:hypothetical protein